MPPAEEKASEGNHEFIDEKGAWQACASSIVYARLCGNSFIISC